jgi:alpha-tubulin suppressor-like RCC1 family protein
MSSLSQRIALWSLVVLVLASGCNVLFGVDASSLPPQDASGSAGTSLGSGGAAGQGATGGGGNGVEGSAGGSGGAAGGQAGSSGDPELITQIAAGGAMTCALSQKGTARCWGSAFAGQLGNGTFDGAIPRPVLVLRDADGNPLEGVRQLALGGSHACALLDEGTVRCWGDNNYGQLGSGVSGGRFATPVPVRDFGGAPLGGVRQIALGREHGCALLTTGGLRCWGSNASKQLGDTLTGVSSTPIGVSGGGVGDNVRQVALGATHTCALLTDATVRCWGENTFGQAGGDAPEASATPAPVRDAAGTTLADVEQIALGAEHSCARLRDGRARCWGLQSAGQLGNGPPQTGSTSLAEAVVDAGGAELGGLQDLRAGGSHTCARLADGTARCWGDNFDGQLGRGTQGGSSPVPLSPKDESSRELGDVRQLALGKAHACALLGDGSLRCWGDNDAGQLGNGVAGLAFPAPAQVGGPAPLGSVREVALGGGHVCARLSVGALRCWGNNDAGQLGNGSSGGAFPLPLPVKNSGGTDLGDVQQLALGYLHTCALFNDGLAACWGHNLDGQLGAGDSLSSALPKTVRNATNTGYLGTMQQLALGDNHTCARLADGTVACWGRNVFKQLGNDAAGESSPLPVAVSGLGGVQQIAAGSSHTCARLADGTARCWGYNFNGQLGDGTSADAAVPVTVVDAAGAPLGGIREIALGSSHSCVVLADATVRCWGDDSAGQLGDGSPGGAIGPPTVVKVASGQALGGVEHVALGNNHSCARLTTGRVQCWGGNVHGQLGNGVAGGGQITAPAADATAGAVKRADGSDFGDVQRLVSRSERTCAVLNDETLWCWGSNEYGALGTGAPGSTAVALAVAVHGVGATP